MIYKVAFLPSIMNTITEELDNDDPIFSQILSLLKDISINCVIIYNDDTYLDRFLGIFERFPIKYRKTAKQYLVFLKKRNRFIRKDCNSQLNIECQDSNCIKLISIAFENKDIQFISNNDCILKIRSQKGLNINLNNIDNYIMTNIHDNIHEYIPSLKINKRSWKTIDFERKVLIPIFNVSKNITLSDRYIGSTMVFDGNRFVLQDNYLRTIRWILDVFLQNGHEGKRFIIKTGCGDKDKQLIRKGLEDFKKSILSTYGFQNIDIQVLQNMDIDHARYLHTDQIDIMIERGFDLFNENKRYSRSDCFMKDVVLTYLK